MKIFTKLFLSSASGRRKTAAKQILLLFSFKSEITVKAATTNNIIPYMSSIFFLFMNDMEYMIFFYCDYSTIMRTTSSHSHSPFSFNRKSFPSSQLNSIRRRNFFFFFSTALLCSTYDLFTLTLQLRLINHEMEHVTPSLDTMKV